MRRRRYYLLWLLLPLLTLGVYRGPTQAQRQMIQDIEQGSIFAWARHITGQDPNDLTSWDDFESVAVIPGTSDRADGEARHDDEVWVVVQRDVNGVSVRYVEQFQPLDWGDDPNFCWFVDCAGKDANGIATEAIPEVPEIPGSYSYTYISENGTIYGVPMEDTTLITLDVGGVAVNYGGGVVGLPYTSNPFIAGDNVRIAGTTNYNGEFVVQAGTSTSEIRILDSYAAETFDGSESVVKYLDDLRSSRGHMTVDSDGNVYYSHTWSSTIGTCVTKIQPDGTQVTDFLTWPFAGTNGSTECVGIALTSDESFLYVATSAANKVTKFQVSDGTSVWSVTGTGSADHVIDEDGNVYASSAGVKKYATADGTATTLTLIGQTLDVGKTASVGRDVAVDNDLGIVVWGGYQYCANGDSDAIKNRMYNLAVRTFDDSAGDRIRVGDLYADTVTRVPTIAFGYLQTYDGYIYVIISSSTPSSTLYKLRWTGSALELVDTVAGPTYGVGIYFDLWGNLVAVNQSSSVVQTNVLYFYDTDLSLLHTQGDFYNSMLLMWTGAYGGSSYIRGQAFPSGDLGTPGTPAVPATTGHNSVGDQLDGEWVCVYSDAIPRGSFLMDGNDIADFNEADHVTTIAGLNYYSIFETLPLRNPVTLGRQSAIKDVQLNVHETDGVHVGADRDHSADWKFFRKSFLMKDAAARDANETVALPYSGEPFAAGEEIYLKGTTNYDGIYTLAADTNNVELRITATYVAETFDGSEWLVAEEAWEPYTGYKGPAPFLRGMTRAPSIYLWEWDPVPLTVRSITTNMEVTVE